MSELATDELIELNDAPTPFEVMCSLYEEDLPVKSIELTRTPAGNLQLVCLDSRCNKRVSTVYSQSIPQGINVRHDIRWWFDTVRVGFLYRPEGGDSADPLSLTTEPMDSAS